MPAAGAQSLRQALSLPASHQRVVTEFVVIVGRLFLCEACHVLVYVADPRDHDFQITLSKRRDCEQARAVGRRAAWGRSMPRLEAAAARSMAAVPLGISYVRAAVASVQLVRQNQLGSSSLDCILGVAGAELLNGDRLCQRNTGPDIEAMPCMESADCDHLYKFLFDLTDGKNWPARFHAATVCAFS